MVEICHVTTAHRVNDVRIVEKECRALAGIDGYRVTIVGEGVPPSDVSMRHFAIGAAPSNRLVRLGTASPRALWAIRNIHADVWHFHDPELLPVAIWLARRGRRVIWDAHEDYLDQIDSAAGKEWIPPRLRGSVRKLFGATLRSIDRRAVAIVAATGHIAASYENRRTVVVGNEARDGEFAECRPTFQSKNLLFTGTANEMTCFPALVEAVRGLPGFTLTTAGSPLSREMASLARSALGDRLLELGYLDRNGLKAAIDRSLIGFVTYADRPTYATNCPNKLFEFAAAGLPSVGTPNPSFTARVAEGEFGVVARDFTAAGLRDAIVLAAADADSWEMMSNNGRIWSGKAGSWNLSSETLKGVYADVLLV